MRREVPFPEVEQACACGARGLAWPLCSLSFPPAQAGLVAWRAEVLWEGWGGSFAGVGGSIIQSKCSSSSRSALSH